MSDTASPIALEYASTTSGNPVTSGQQVSIVADTSKSVSVDTTGGIPFLTLDNGAVATYAGQQDAYHLIFVYTVMPGQGSGNLGVTGFNPNGASIIDSSGNAVGASDFDGMGTGIIVATQPSGSIVNIVHAGQQVTITTTTSEAVFVDTTGGTPFLTLDDGGRAVYVGQQDAEHLVFAYTVAVGDNTGSLTVTGFNLNGSSVTDTAGNAVDVSSFAHALGTSTGIVVDTLPPSANSPRTTSTVTQVVTSDTNADNAIYRFFNTGTGSHFYTGSADEVSQILASRPDLVQERSSFQGVNQHDVSAQAIYRFFDTGNGEHFLTSDQAEVKTVMQTRPDLVYEGVDFYEHATQQAGDTAVYRFFDNTNGSHLYTTAASEQLSLGANPGFTAEGIAFWAPPSR